MRLASLFSGGKDSTYATRLEIENGYNVKYLIIIQSKRDDSWMFHTVNIGIAPLVAKAVGIQSVISDTSGDKEKELDDLKNVLKSLDIDGVVTGAIASTYQKKRIDLISKELGLIHFSPLWKRNRFDLLEEMLSRKMIIMVTEVAARGLDQKWLGRTLDKDSVEELKELSRRFGVDACGEGGEMETIVLDAPWFESSIDVKKASSLWDGMRGTYHIEEAVLMKKSED